MSFFTTCGFLAACTFPIHELDSHATESLLRDNKQSFYLGLDVPDHNGIRIHDIKVETDKLAENVDDPRYEGEFLIHLAPGDDARRVTFQSNEVSLIILGEHALPTDEVIATIVGNVTITENRASVSEYAMRQALDWEVSRFGAALPMTVEFAQQHYDYVIVGDIDTPEERQAAMGAIDPLYDRYVTLSKGAAPEFVDEEVALYKMIRRMHEATRTFASIR